MKKEATINEWKKLYELTTRVKELEPWEHFWDMDIIGIQEGAKEDAAFISILGKGGDCYGLSVYEGYKGMNDFLMLAMQESLNITAEYAMFSQNNLSCYFGGREELSEKQRSIIKELGYKYRGKNQWLYFMSYQLGYYPYNYNQDEVRRMIKYITRLIEALEYYHHNNLTINFDHGNMYLFSYDQNTRQWAGVEQELPFRMYQFQKRILTDEKLMQKLRTVNKGKLVLEADIAYMGTSIDDKKYDRPVNPRLCLIGDSTSGMILNADMIEPNEDANVKLVEKIIGLTLNCGAPKEIRVGNVIVEAMLEQICEICGIKLRKVQRLTTFTQILNGMKRN